jgi:hypothetical protein
LDLLFRRVGTEGRDAFKVGVDLSHVSRVRGAYQNIETAFDGLDILLQRLKLRLILAPSVRPKDWDFGFPHGGCETLDNGSQLIQLGSCLLQQVPDVDFVMFDNRRARPLFNERRHLVQNQLKSASLLLTACSRPGRDLQSARKSMKALFVEIATAPMPRAQ